MKRHLKLVAILCNLWIGTLLSVNAGQTDVKENVAHASESNEISFMELIQCARDAQLKRDYSSALDYLEIAKTISEEKSDKSLLVCVFIQLSDLYLTAGQRNEAESFGYKALEMTSSIEDAALNASSLNNWGNILIQYEDYYAAIDAYDESFTLSKDSGNLDASLRALSNLVRTALIIDDLEIVYDALEDARSLFKEMTGELSKQWQMQFAIHSQALIKKGPEPEIRDELIEWVETIWQEIAATAEQNKDIVLKSRAYGNLGTLYESKGDYPAALQSLRRALFAAESAQRFEMSYNWYWQLGRLYRRQGQREEALVAYLEAIKDLTAVRNQLLEQQRNKTVFFKENIKPLYYELAELYIDIADEAPALANDYLKNSRLIIEKMKQAELENLFNDECVVQFKKRSVSLDRMPQNTALLYPLMFPEKLVLLLAIGDEILPYKIPIDAETLTQNVLEFRKRLQTRPNKLFYKPGSKIYDLMIRPVKEELNQHAIDTLVIVPDGVFSLIPFAPLFDLEKNEFLIQQYAVATSLGMELADPQPLSREDVKILLLGLSHAVQDHSALPGGISNLYQI